MLRLRLKRGGKKRNPIYRIVIMNNTTKRDGKTIEEVGFYNPITKQIRINVTKVITRLTRGTTFEYCSTIISRSRNYYLLIQ